MGRHEYRVKPSSADINENILSEQCRDDYKLTEEDVKSARSLGEVLRQFDVEVAQGTLGGDRNFTLVIIKTIKSHVNIYEWRHALMNGTKYLNLSLQLSPEVDVLEGEGQINLTCMTPVIDAS